MSKAQYFKCDNCGCTRKKPCTCTKKGEKNVKEEPKHESKPNV